MSKKMRSITSLQHTVKSYMIEDDLGRDGRTVQLVLCGFWPYPCHGRRPIPVVTNLASDLVS
jgi:hypothetical protein